MSLAAAADTIAQGAALSPWGTVAGPCHAAASSAGAVWHSSAALSGADTKPLLRWWAGADQKPSLPSALRREPSSRGALAGTMALLAYALRSPLSASSCARQHTEASEAGRGVAFHCMDV